jgi:methylglyoxal synthase
VPWNIRLSRYPDGCQGACG